MLMMQKCDNLVGMRLEAIASQASELALLREFKQHDSVMSLAEAISKRLGAETRTSNLILEAGLRVINQRPER